MEVRVPASDPMLQMAARISEVLRFYRDRDVPPEAVDLRVVSDLVWALGVQVQFSFMRKEAA